MPAYIYGCKVNDHPTLEISHGIKEVVHLCCGVCGGELTRIPQPFQTRVPPMDSGQRRAKEINNWLESSYVANKERREASEAAHAHAKEKQK